MFVLEDRDSEELVLVLQGYFALLTERELTVNYIKSALDETREYFQIYLCLYCFISAINMATPNYSVCTCPVIGNRYILWSYYSTQLRKYYGIIFQFTTSLFIYDPSKVEEVFALFPTPKAR